MRHPFENISSPQRKRWFWPLFVVTLAIMALMNLTGMALITTEAPSGIVSFELAGGLAKVIAILASWGCPAISSAAG
jgi:hypothetical protein